MEKNVRGKGFLVTGGAMGMGKRVAERFARDGARVVIWDMNKDALEKTEAEFKGRGYDVTTYTVDVSDREAVYAAGEEAGLAGVVGALLAARGATLAVAESCTGGLLGERLTRVPGASAFFLGGIIAYQNRLKTEWLEVAPELLAETGAVSPAVARAMAEGVRTRCGATTNGWERRRRSRSSL